MTPSAASNPNPYKILGVSTSSTQDAIKGAYRDLAKKYHPDLNPGNKEAEAKFKEISSAYELIGTADSRSKFDRGEFEAKQNQGYGARNTQGNPYYYQTQEDGGRYNYSFEGMDDELLNSIFGRARTKRSDFPGQDVLYQMDIDFKDAVLGAEREIQLESGKRLRVKIPPGVDSGTKLRFGGQGHPGAGKGGPGNAYVQLNVRRSSIFSRDGDNLEIELPISLSEALLGADIKVPTIDGSVLLHIPEGVGSGTRLRVKGKGIQRKGKTSGDQFVRIKIVTPKSVDSDFKAAVKSWSERYAENPREAWIGNEEGVR